MTDFSASSLLKAPALRLFLVYATLLCLATWYGRSHFYRDPGSVFFNKDRAFEEYYTAHRRTEARETLAQYGWPSETSNITDAHAANNITKASSSPTVCVSFLTVKRRGTQYIEEAFGSALAGLAPEERQQAHIGVFFAHTDPYEHPTYNASWLWSLADSVYSYELDAATLRNVTEWEETHDFHAKSVFDYTYALEWCHATGAPYTLMLEGDVLLADSWLVQVLAAVRQIPAQLHLTTAEWLYLRLFNQERSTGWAGRRIGANNEFVIAAGVIGVVLGAALVVRRCAGPTARCRHVLDNSTLAVVCLIIIPSAIIFFFQAGKASLLPPSPGLKLENFGCCSQALLYPREQIPALVDRLRGPESGSWTGQYDLRINKHAGHWGLKRVTLYPILVQHMGIESTAHEKVAQPDEARSVWSTAFESLSPEELRETHRELLREELGIELD